MPGGSIREANSSAKAIATDNIDWHGLKSGEVLSRLETSVEEGLSDDEARLRLERVGPNELEQAQRKSPLRIFLSQFEEALVLILIAAAALSLGLWIYLREELYPYDFIIITAIVLLNAVLGFIQEYRAEKSMEALKSLSAPEARVLRERSASILPAREVVPGDVLLIEAGDRIPADARIIQTVGLTADESLLTGESLSVDKHPQVVEPAAPVAERSNLLHAGTAAVAGRGRAVVVATGMETELGNIASAVATAETVTTPLQRDMAALGRMLGIIVLAIAAIVTLVALIPRGGPTAEGLITIILFGVALAVAAIPEGLPAVVTVALALGVRRMAARGAIVRRLPAVETLGSTTVICTDKTGTITRNELEVAEAYVHGQRTRLGTLTETEPDRALAALLRAGVLCNNALELGQGADPTEIALIKAAERARIDVAALTEDYPRLSERPFSSESKRMTTVHRTDENAVAFTKGAPEVILDRCSTVGASGGSESLTPDIRASFEQAAADFAVEGLRVLGVAEKRLDTAADHDAEEEGLTLLGLVAMMDPPRTEVTHAIASCHSAGISVIMITGDHMVTALSVAKRIGLWEEGDTSISGAELEHLSDEELQDRLERVRIFARVDPAHKIRIVHALQAKGHIVAMTGDGVNDAPALKRADIGVAMGIAGTDVAREASDMVLTNDDFATIVAAVEEGRGIFDNIRRFTSFLLGTNSGEVLTLFFGVILAAQLGLMENGMVLVPLLAIHILWINLVTDGAPALALGVEPRTSDVLKRPPRPPKESVITKDMWYGIVLMGTTMCIGTLALLDAFTPQGFLFANNGSINYARTVAFTVLVLFQLLDALNWRSYPKSIFRVPLFANKWLIVALGSSLLLHLGILYVPSLAAGFRSVGLSPGNWLTIILVASSVLVVMEIYKAWLRKTEKKQGG